MKVRIEDDVFNVVKRIKEIDDGYYILYDQNKQVYEIHNYNQENTYCLTVPFNSLDSRVVDTLLYTSIGNIDNILNDIDINNTNLEKQNNKNLKSQTDYMLYEIYNFSNNSSKDIGDNSFTTAWR